jgi:hypothetical protein
MHYYIMDIKMKDLEKNKDSFWFLFHQTVQQNMVLRKKFKPIKDILKSSKSHITTTILIKKNVSI